MNKIYLLVDCDLDGYLSASMAYIYIKKINPHIEIIPLFHNENPKAHGLQDDEILDFLKSEIPSVLFITDAGSSDCNECKILSELGWCIYIADHHLCTENNPYATIVNNQSSNNVENKDLCGCGVTWKVLAKIDELNSTNYTKDLISYVHIANIADSCLFINAEQHTFRYWGLQNIHKNLLPFFNAFNYNQNFDNMAFSFGMISKINAVIRVGNIQDKRKIFKSLCGEFNYNEAIEICNKCYQEQSKQRDSLLEQNIYLVNDKNIMLYKIDIKTPLTGLIANKLMSEYQKPVMILHDRENGEVSGSVRSPLELQPILEKSNLFNYNKGHLCSFGTSYQKDKEQDIINYINQLQLHEPCIDVLKSYSIKDIPYNLFELFDPSTDVLWGNGISKPMFEIHDIIYYPADVKILGDNKRTLKITYISEIQDINILIFNATKQNKIDLGLGYLDDKGNFIDFELNEFPAKKILNVVGTIGINKYIGRYGKIYINNQIIVDKFETKVYNMIRKEDLFK